MDWATVMKFATDLHSYISMWVVEMQPDILIKVKSFSFFYDKQKQLKNLWLKQIYIIIFTIIIRFLWHNSWSLVLIYRVYNLYK